MQNANIPVSESDAESLESNEECCHGHEAVRSGLAHVASFAPGQSGSSPRPGKKTRGRVKIKMEFINNKLRRYTTFSKRKTGIMKKAYELSTLTGTQVMLLVASETGHVYTFATRKLQPMITSESGKALIQTCLNSPDSPPRPNGGSDQRMSATGFEETELSYAMPDGETAIAEDKEVMRTALVTVRSVPGALQPPGGTISTVQLGSSPGFPLTNYMGSVLGPTVGGSNNVNKSTTTANTAHAATIVPTSLTVMPGTLFPAGTPTVSLGSLVPQLALSTQCACSVSSTHSAPQTVFRFPPSAHQILSIANNMAQPLQTIHVPPTSMVQQVGSSTTSTSGSTSSSSTIVNSNSAPFALQPPPGTLTLQAATPIPITLQSSTGQQITLQQQQQQQQAVTLVLQPAAAPLPAVTQPASTTTTSSTVTLLDTSQGAAEQVFMYLHSIDTHRGPDDVPDCTGHDVYRWPDGVEHDQQCPWFGTGTRCANLAGCPHEFWPRFTHSCECRVCRSAAAAFLAGPASQHEPGGHSHIQHSDAARENEETKFLTT
uniref:serum response factor-like isoform X3 n=1 Tax=Myxine glutinosa TaxID=7769 RepID=UPI00358E90F5